MYVFTEVDGAREVRYLGREVGILYSFEYGRGVGTSNRCVRM